MVDALVWEVNGNRTIVTISFEPSGSCFVVFRNKISTLKKVYKNLRINGKPVNLFYYLAYQNGQAHTRLNEPGSYELISQSGKSTIVKHDDPVEKIMLNEDWTIRFQANRGAPAQAHFDKLFSWSEHSETGIKYFSGKAIYSKTFQLNQKQLSSGKRIFLDLGRVKNVATVIVNQKEVRVMWKPPFTLDITDFCEEGNNMLEVEVTNLWPNRIIGDKSEPDDCVWGPVREFEYAKPNPKIGRNLQLVPDWVKNHTERPSKNRITFCTMDYSFFEKNTPLLPSGLIGPVQLSIEDIWKLR
jgi:hypothetical protein